jgi:hypothetical protein
VRGVAAPNLRATDPPLAPAVADHVVALTLEPPPGETTHWSAHAMARQVGMSVSSVQHVSRAPASRKGFGAVRPLSPRSTCGNWYRSRGERASGKELAKRSPLCAPTLEKLRGGDGSARTFCATTLSCGGWLADA